nr:MAG TPA: hypothetical protein [Caudoviricetes sp.]
MHRSLKLHIKAPFCPIKSFYHRNTKKELLQEINPKVALLLSNINYIYDYSTI